MRGAGSDSTLLVVFRWTWRQALARGLRLGALLALGATAAALAAVGVLQLVGSATDRGGATLPPLAWVAIVAVSLVVGAAAGLIRGRDVGADADDLGIRLVPASAASFAPWQRIADIRAERHRRRTVVSIYLDTGAMLRLHAPYDGALLAHDPLFERKMFNLRNLWETHRRWEPR